MLTFKTRDSIATRKNAFWTCRHGQNANLDFKRHMRASAKSDHAQVKVRKKQRQLISSTVNLCDWSMDNP